MTERQAPRLLIVATDALGWRSQRDALLWQLEQTAPQLEVRTLDYRPPALVRPLFKDVYARYRRRRLGLFSSMVWAKHGFSGALAREVRSFAPDAVLFLGHFSAAALPAGLRTFRAALMADITIPLARRLFLPTQFKPADETDELRVALGMDVIFGNSAGVVDSFKRDHGIDSDRVQLCRPFSRLAEPMTPCSPPPATRPTVGFVGNDFERKGGDLLLQAFRSGASRHVDLLLVGRGTEKLPQLPGLTALGPVPNDILIAEVMPRFDIFCLPTREDTNPLVLAEAASLGIPCVATDVGFIREIVLHETTGLLVPIDNVEALAVALSRLAADKELRARFGVAAAKHIRRQFMLADNVALMLDALLPAGAPWADRPRAAAPAA